MIRPARADEAAALAPLFLHVLEAMELPFLAAHGIETTRSLLTTAIQAAEYRYGYARAIVKTIDGCIAGAAFGYPSEVEPLVDLPFTTALQQSHLDSTQRLFTDPESYPGRMVSGHHRRRPHLPRAWHWCRTSGCPARPSTRCRQTAYRSERGRSQPCRTSSLSAPRLPAGRQPHAERTPP